MTVSRSIVVPCYNEAPNLPALLARFRAIRSRPGAEAWELILVDNGSTDGSAEILHKAVQAEGGSWLRVAAVAPPNIGYGHGILVGLRAARGELLAWTHADGQTPPLDAVHALERLAASAHPARTLVKGRRRGRPLKDAAFTFGMELAALGILGQRLPDINGQPKAFHRDLLDAAASPPSDLSLDLHFLSTAERLGFEISSFDVQFGLREHGESKWAFNWQSKRRAVARTLRCMVELRAAPGAPAAGSE